MTRRITATVWLDGESNAPACAACRHRLSAAGTPWKSGATMREIPVRGAGGAAYGGGEKVVLRQFFCPSCGRLLDTETALPEDPFLDDAIKT